MTLRRLAIGIGLLVFLVAVGWLTQYQHQHREERDRAAYSATNDDFKDLPTTCMHVPLLNAYTCSVRIQRPVDSDPYAKYDLHAQQDMAESALAMALLTFFGLAVTSIGLIYIILAYQMNAAATDHARAAANAATAQAVTAHAAFVAERRPWLSVEVVEVGSVENKTALNIPLRIVIRNVGGSPAHDVSLDYRWNFGIGVQHHWTLEGLREGAKSKHHMLAGEHVVFPQQAFTDGGTMMIGDGQVKSAYPEEPQDFRRVLVNVFGVVSYRSLYDKEIHTTGFSVTLMRTDMVGAHSIPYGPNAPELPAGVIAARRDRTGWFAD